MRGVDRDEAGVGVCGSQARRDRRVIDGGRLHEEAHRSPCTFAHDPQRQGRRAAERTADDAGPERPGDPVEDLAYLIRRGLVVAPQAQFGAEHPARLGAPAASAQARDQHRHGEEEHQAGGVGGEVEAEAHRIGDPREGRGACRGAARRGGMRARGRRVAKEARGVVVDLQQEGHEAGRDQQQGAQKASLEVGHAAQAWGTRRSRTRAADEELMPSKPSCDRARQRTCTGVLRWGVVSLLSRERCGRAEDGSSGSRRRGSGSRGPTVEPEPAASSLGRRKLIRPPI